MCKSDTAIKSEDEDVIILKYTNNKRNFSDAVLGKILLQFHNNNDITKVMFFIV